MDWWNEKCKEWTKCYILAYMDGYRQIQMDGLMDELMYRQT
jgi:hypothetical protein